MRLNFDIPSPLQYFSSLVQSDEHFPLLEAAVSLAQDEYPELDVQQVLGDVDQLLARLKRRVPPDAPAMQRLRALNQFFFQDLNFGGNVNDYYDPDNSFVHVLLKTRRGIPITLAVLWLELAQGMDLATSVMPFILRGVTLAGIDSVMAPLTRRQRAWDRLARDLDPALLEAMVQEVPLEGAVARAHELMAGRVRGRTVIEIGS